jgi:hypothetical protein
MFVLISDEEFTFLDVIKIHGDVSTLVGALLFVVEPDDVHQFVNNSREMNASVVETQLLCATRLLMPRPAAAKLNF